MNFNIYLEDALGDALKRLAKRRRTSRNALIRQAVEHLLTQDNEANSWSTTVLQWQGDPSAEPFEAHRAKLRPPVEDPLA